MSGNDIGGGLIADVSPLDNLYPALVQCFAIIICGYVAGRANLVSQTEAKGMNTFVSTFSLPALIFLSLTKLQWSSVNWTFLLSILISKSLIFLSVIAVSLLIARPTNAARAGLFAIFCTQSNDFAIGYPIVEALYKNSHPDYASYIYLMAPINLAILNPIAFVLMEVGVSDRRLSSTNAVIGSQDNASNEHSPATTALVKLQAVARIAQNIITNPIILMTVLGVIGNFVFHQQVPRYVLDLLEVLGSAFSANALFLLGLRMVGQVRQLKGLTLVTIGILLMVKLIGMPLVIREVISLLHVSSNVSDTSDFSTYGFLYGTFPSAPTVYVFAHQYSVDTDLIASAMVACTFISAPLMFVSAQMVQLPRSAPSEYVHLLRSFNLDVGVVSLLACIWIILLFVVTKKMHKLPHKVTIFLVISQLIGCIGTIVVNKWPDASDGLRALGGSLLVCGVFSSRIWTALLAATLVFLKYRSLCFVLNIQSLFVLIGWGLPVLMALTLVIFDQYYPTTHDLQNPSFMYGSLQAIMAVSLLLICFTVTLGCLILLQRYHRPLPNNGGIPVIWPFDDEPDSLLQNDQSPQDDGCGRAPTVPDIEDLLQDTATSTMCSDRYHCESHQRQQCHSLVVKYAHAGANGYAQDVEVIQQSLNDPQYLRHIILLILLCGSMFVGLALSVWSLLVVNTEQPMSGVYWELTFIDATLNYGQAIIVFGTFVVDSKRMLMLLCIDPFIARIRRMLARLMPEHCARAHDQVVCHQFRSYHLKRCRDDLTTPTKQNFYGHQLADWLLDAGLAAEPADAISYATRLLKGGVLQGYPLQSALSEFFDDQLSYSFVI